MYKIGGFPKVIEISVSQSAFLSLPKQLIPSPVRSTYFLSEVKVWRQLIILFRCFVFCNFVVKATFNEQRKAYKFVSCSKMLLIFKSTAYVFTRCFLLICQIPRHELYAFVNKLDRY